MLETLGLGPNDERVYRALLDHPSRTRLQMAAELDDLDASRVGAILRRLVAAELVTIADRRPTRYSAIPPDVSIESIAARQLGAAHALQSSVPELMDLYWRGRQAHAAADFIEIVRAPAPALRQRAGQLQLAARQSIRAFERPPFPWGTAPLGPDRLAEEMATNMRYARASLARGVVHRVIYERAQTDDAHRWSTDIIASLEAGEQARVLPTLPLKLILYDDWAATINPVTDENGVPVASVIVHRSPLLDGLAALFEAHWQLAVPLTVSLDNPPQLDDSEDLLRLLAAGMTDEAIGRNLGISRSTVQRRVTTLMERTGSRTRFQLGLQIASRFGEAAPRE